jgi:hypothetical protein
MVQTAANPALGQAAGAGDRAFPGGNSNFDIAPKCTYAQEERLRLLREFISECLRIAALKAAHGADNLDIGDDYNTERDIRSGREHARGRSHLS